ncbi:predicted protein [Naegleria gruberi]|uniref:Predicted protein n=1 Tax=Naegleria gruberi TaxID=5762 RepID=D2V9A6_NAEGR|nr:uncharacterized protein NAEGRDRAFT_65373 [Naegleria gruberi]EFC46557.1 predicted protein [Naegleria gruberi]|eukprot:XP_002679301.1 predicted protein [Naegleria gruberi strain NEG-M]
MSSPARTFDSPARAKLSELTFKYETKPIINPNPELANKSEAELTLEKVPDYIQTLLYGKSKDKIHASCMLRKISDEKILRKSMAMINNFIEAISAILVIEQENDAHKRCQQHALAILGNLLLEDPIIDAFIANEENCLPGLAKMLCSSDRETVELAARVLDYMSVTFQNQTLVCGTDTILYGIVQSLRSSGKSLKIKHHIIQALVYLSANPKNRFMIARENGIFDEINAMIDTHHRLDEQHNVPKMAMQVMYNLCLLKENIPLIAKHGIRHTIKKKLSIVKESIQSTNGGERQYPGYQSDLLIWKLSSVVMDLLGLFERRFESQSVLNGTGFNAPIIEVGNHKARSIVLIDEEEESKLPKNISMDSQSTNERRRRAAARRNKTTEDIVLDNIENLSP